jgi:hypothetical protein
MPNTGITAALYARSWREEKKLFLSSRDRYFSSRCTRVTVGKSSR